MSSPAQVWRVSTFEGVFETDLETLRQWIAEGAVLPTDKVSKGSLNWIEAGRAPMLRSAFDGSASNGAGTVEITATPVSPDFSEATSFQAPTAHTGYSSQTSETSSAPNYVVTASVSGAAVCHNHPEAAPDYICRICGATFCAQCPRFVGTSKVPVCPLCGDLCKPLAQEVSKAVHQQFRDSGFGFGDFAKALAYPLNHKVALLSGALLYAFLLLAGFRGHLVASIVMFGCISHVISQVAWGRLNRSFMPDFSAFSMWDDVAVPIGLGIGITIVTWGPVIALVVAFFFGVLKGPSISPLGGMTSPSAQHQTGPSPEDLSALTDPEADSRKLEEANKKLDQLRPGQQIAEQAERSKQQESDPLATMRLFLSYVHVPFWIVLWLLLGIGWAFFYGPMALAVAGYTQSFAAVINPLVGLDTIRRMGVTYFKAFGMVVLIQIASVIAGVIVAVITSPFAMPLVGNLPAKFIDGAFTFYFNLVVACVLGLSLFKCADRLGIDVD